jgi:hypothetical protein
MPIFSLPASPRRRATSASAVAQPRGFTPPAFAATLMPRATIVGRIRSIWVMKSVA